jgi:metallo-beta-lactamase family protein
MRIRFAGAAQTTTGSMHVLLVNGKQVVLDCGLFQGRRKEAFERNRHLPVDPGAVDAVVLSHAHIDHSGNLPTLVRRGFRGPIYATPATVDLCDIMLRDSAYLQGRDVEYVNKKRRREGKNPFEPLYVPEDVDQVMEQFVRAEYGRQAEVVPGVAITFQDAGHILGSAFTRIELEENGTRRCLFYSGDMGRKDMPILRDPVVVNGCDTLLTESTYGNRFHPPRRDVAETLRNLVNAICKQGSKLVIPAFSVGRTQQLVYFLNELHRDGEIEELPVFVDSPLSTRATKVHERHPECFDQDAIEHLTHGDAPFSFPKLRYITEVEDSKALNHQPGPMVIISASGMCEGGRILHHLKNNIEDPKNIVLFVGYQAEHTLGRYLLEGNDPVRIYGEEYTVRARMETINALSAHADHREILDYYRSMDAAPRRAFVVHGEPEPAEAIAAGLRDLGIGDVDVPRPGQEFPL